MKHLTLLFLLGWFAPCVAQITIDGNLNDADYITVARYTSGRDGFGVGNNLHDIRYYADGDTLWIGITCDLNDDNQVAIFFDFSGYTGRSSALNGGGPNENFFRNDGVGGSTSGTDDAIMDLDADFAIAVNEGFTTTTAYYDIARYGGAGLLLDNTLNITDQSGTPVASAATAWGGGENIICAYNNSGGASGYGIEFKIPITGFAGVTNMSTLKLFTYIADFTGFASNECIPGDAGSSNPGNDADWTGYTGQSFFTNELCLDVSSWNGSAWSNGDPAGTDKMAIYDGSRTLSADVSYNCFYQKSGTITVNSGVNLTATRYAHINGNIDLANSASLVQPTGSEASGSGTIDLTRNTGLLDNDRFFNYWSPPVTSETMGSVFTGSNSADFYHFDEAAQNWASQASGDIMTPGKGYITTGTVGISNSSENRTFSGFPNNGDITYAAATDASGEVILVGNPYPSAISNATFIADNPDLDGSIYLWDHFTDPNNNGGSNNAADYATWNSIGSVVAGLSTVAPGDYISAGQGFFVSADVGTSFNTTFNNGQRVSGNNTPFFSPDPDLHRVWLNLVNDNNDFNQILIGFTPEATQGVDRGKDAWKFKGHPRVAFSSKIDSGEYIIQGLPHPEEDSSMLIPLSIDAWVTGLYRIDLDRFSNWPEDYELRLIDSLTNKVISMEVAKTYPFPVSQIGSYSNRFFLEVYRAPRDTTNTETGIADDVLIVAPLAAYFSNVKEAWLIEAPAPGEVEIYNLSGTCVGKASITEGFNEVPGQGLPAGVYILKYKGEEVYLTTKSAVIR